MGMATFRPLAPKPGTYFDKTWNHGHFTPDHGDRHRSPLSGVKYDRLLYSRYNDGDKTLIVGREINHI